MIVNGLFEFGPYRLDAAKRLLTRDGNSVTLAPKTYELLLLMVQSDGRALSKQELLRALWADTFVEEASLAFQVNALRKALGDDGNEWIETVPRHGYRFTASVSKTLTYGERAAELVSPSVSATPARATRLLALIAVLSTAAAVLFGALYFRRSPAVERQVRFLLSPPENVTFSAVALPALSPDGEKLVFGGVDPDRRSRLWIRPLDSVTAMPLSGTEGAVHPFWSPDSRSIGFFTNGKLKRVNLGSGPPQTICNVSPSTGDGTWNRNGVILFSTNDGNRLFRVVAAGGEATPATTLDAAREEIGHAWPQFLPDGRHYIFLVRSKRQENTGIFLGTIDSEERRRLIDVHAQSVYAQSHTGVGYLLFLRDSTLTGQQFDVTKLEFRGKPFPVAEYVPTGLAPWPGYGVFTASHNGVLAYGTRGWALTEMVWLDRQGRRLGAVGEPGEYSNPALSRDGKKLAVCRLNPEIGTRDIWLFDLPGGNSSRLTFDPADELNPSWSPDGTRIAFNRVRNNIRDIYQKTLSGQEPELLLTSGENKHLSDWSPDGRFLSYGSGGHLWLLPLAGDRKPQPFNASGGARFSPDGQWLAYEAIDTGRPEVYVTTFPGAGSKWQITTGGGEEPHWRGDGKELFYMSAKNLMAVDVKTNGPKFEWGTARPLFEPRLEADLRMTRYLVAPDGQKFLVNMPLRGSSASPVTVVSNWTAALTK